MSAYPRIVYEGRVFAVELDSFSLADGRHTEIAIVRHRPSVVIIPTHDDGTVVLIRQYRHALRRRIWEFPAGNLEPGEAPESAAARECEEEIGLTPGRVERLGSFFPLPGYCDEEMIFFRASDLRPPSPDSKYKPDDDEDIESLAMAADAAKALLARGEIIDLKTAYALTLL